MIEYVPHLADVCIRVRGDTQKDLFENALEGMNQILKPDSGVEEKFKRKRTFRLDATDNTLLLIDFLSEVLTCSYIDKVLYTTIQYLKIGQGRLEAILVGESFDVLEEEIKAVTYHEANIHQDAAGCWETLIIFDT